MPETTPKPDMTRDELTTWLLGLSTAHNSLYGIAFVNAVGPMVDRLTREAGKQIIKVTVADGTRYEVSASKSGPWYRRTVAYHARRWPARLS